VRYKLGTAPISEHFNSHPLLILSKLTVTRRFQSSLPTHFYYVFEEGEGESEGVRQILPLIFIKTQKSKSFLPSTKLYYFPSKTKMIRRKTVGCFGLLETKGVGGG
jgi:hypothetical protein